MFSFTHPKHIPNQPLFVDFNSNMTKKCIPLELCPYRQPLSIKGTRLVATLIYYLDNTSATSAGVGGTPTFRLILTTGLA